MSEKTPVQQLQEYRELVGYILEESGRSSVPHLQCIPKNSLGIRFSSEIDIMTRRVSLRFEYQLNNRQGFVLRWIDEAALKRKDCLKADAAGLVRSAVSEIAEEITTELYGEVVDQVLRSEARDSVFGLALQKSLVNGNV